MLPHLRMVHFGLWNDTGRSSGHASSVGRALVSRPTAEPGSRTDDQIVMSMNNPPRSPDAHHRAGQPGAHRSASLIARFRIAATVVVLAALVLAAITWWAMQSLVGSLDQAIFEVDREAVPFLALDSAMRSTVYLFATSLLDDPSGKAPLDESLVRIDGMLSDLEGPNAPGLAAEQAVIDEAIREWRAAVDAMSEVRASGSGPTDPLVYELYGQINGAADLFAEAHAQAMEEARVDTAKAKELRHRVLLVLALATLGFGAAGLLAARREARTLGGWIRPLQEGASRVARGNLGERVPVVGAAEFADLAEAFNTMAEGIEERETRLNYRALHDPLTELGNRTMLDDRLRTALSRLRRNAERRLALMFVDLDGFKKVNDTLGHDAGDATIRNAAQRIAGCLRDGDTLARLGGDEFAIVAEDVDGAAAALGERVREALAQPFVIGDSHMTLSGSVGIVEATTGRESVGDLLRDADLAMYEAKRAGGNQIRLFRDAFREQALHRTRLEEELRAALEHEELEVHYQPVFDLGSHQLRGVEALVRWRHPERGLLLPDEFVPIAEETGLVVPLGSFVLHRAATDFVHWMDQHDLPADFSLAVNVSARQLALERFAQEVADQLETTGLPASRLILEITETELLAHSGPVRAGLEALRALGVRIALDDFGTGYTTLQYLQELPVDVLKIDRAFVTGLARREDLTALVRTILDLARSYHLGVVAEGVEDPSDVAALQGLGCDLGQGFGLARPAPAAEIERLLDEARVSEAA